MLYFKNEFITLYNEDSLSLLQQLNIKCDAIITDPPYAIQFQKNQWDNKLFDIGIFRNIFYDLLSDDGNLIMFQGWSNVTETIKSFDNFILKNWIIWDRIKGRGAKTNFVSTRQDILWMIKNEKQYIFNPILSNIKKKTGGSIGKKNGCEYRKLSNVWTDISPIVPWSKQRVQHPTQKPLQLMQRIINIFTNENQLILDPFGGSGTTAIACMTTNRKCVIIEKEKDYCDLIINRIKEKEEEISKRLF